MRIMLYYTAHASIVNERGRVNRCMCRRANPVAVWNAQRKRWRGGSSASDLLKGKQGVQGVLQYASR